MKPFGKLSPNDRISASLIPMLYDRPHKVLEKLEQRLMAQKNHKSLTRKSWNVWIWVMY